MRKACAEELQCIRQQLLVLTVRDAVGIFASVEFGDRHLPDANLNVAIESRLELFEFPKQSL